MKKLLLILFLLFPFVSKGQIITKIAGTYIPGYSGNGGPDTSAK